MPTRREFYRCLSCGLEQAGMSRSHLRSRRRSEDLVYMIKIGGWREYAGGWQCPTCIADLRARTESANLYMTYQRGWVSGSACRAIEPTFETHPDQGIRDAYFLGYKDGRAAFNAAIKSASSRYGYATSVLTLQGEPTSTPPEPPAE